MNGGLKRVNGVPVVSFVVFFLLVLLLSTKGQDSIAHVHMDVLFLDSWQFCVNRDGFVILFHVYHGQPYVITPLLASLSLAHLEMKLIHIFLIWQRKEQGVNSESKETSNERGEVQEGK